jgi:hypothetical protein
VRTEKNLRRIRGVPFGVRMALIAGLLVAAGYGVGVWSDGGEPDGVTASQEPPATSGNYDVLWVAPDGQASALLWTSGSDLWWVAFGEGGLVLYHSDLLKDSVDEWAVPFAAQSTPETFLVAAADGWVWVASNYALAAFVPQTGQFEKVIELNPDDAGAGSDHGPGSPLPGTWINGLMGDGNGRLLLTRNNVPQVFEVTASGLRPVRDLTEPPAGLRRFGELALPYVWEGDLVRAPGADGVVENRWEASARSCAVTGSAKDGWLRLSNASNSIELSGLRLHPHDIVVARDGWLAIGLVDEGQVLLADCATLQLERFDLGGSMAFPDGGEASIGEVSMLHSPGSLALGPGGVLAFATSDGRLATANVR